MPNETELILWIFLEFLQNKNSLFSGAANQTGYNPGTSGSHIASSWRQQAWEWGQLRQTGCGWADIVPVDSVWLPGLSHAETTQLNKPEYSPWDQRQFIMDLDPIKPKQPIWLPQLQWQKGVGSRFNSLDSETCFPMDCESWLWCPVLSCVDWNLHHVIFIFPMLHSTVSQGRLIDGEQVKGCNFVY